MKVRPPRNVPVGRSPVSPQHLCTRGAPDGRDGGVGRHTCHAGPHQGEENQELKRKDLSDVQEKIQRKFKDEFPQFGRQREDPSWSEKQEQRHGVGKPGTGQGKGTSRLAGTEQRAGWEGRRLRRQAEPEHNGPSSPAWGLCILPSSQKKLPEHFYTRNRIRTQPPEETRGEVPHWGQLTGGEARDEEHCQEAACG